MEQWKEKSSLLILSLSCSLCVCVSVAFASMGPESLGCGWVDCCCCTVGWKIQFPEKYNHALTVEMLDVRLRDLPAWQLCVRL